MPRENQALRYVKDLMIRADTDGDGKINKADALQFLDKLINEASQLPECTDEVEHLTLVRTVTAKIRKEEFASPVQRFVPEWVINQRLENELKKEPEGLTLLQWYDVPHDECHSMNYVAPKRDKPQGRAAIK